MKWLMITLLALLFVGCGEIGNFGGAAQSNEMTLRLPASLPDNLTAFSIHITQGGSVTDGGFLQDGKADVSSDPTSEPDEAGSQSTE